MTIVDDCTMRVDNYGFDGNGKEAWAVPPPLVLLFLLLSLPSALSHTHSELSLSLSQLIPSYV